ncbi:bifunctional lytic transglycosylase/C40 family peptidase [Nocardiopsis sp. EMB25]|uniref:C40 family peptidase n=1 Tax=Nocardiopsis sp. EMB25 TaxID=2835867 RepID=UPI002283EDB5|nr:bifunctional lytic transglycosylase/C40 family peptidase [Nocardiopsis sp. EMB25]MCY9787116.1 bifunctional lytic transglycosylase/C40 family peptidase [Nocardiopsis sp. EMB25]
MVRLVIGVGTTMVLLPVIIGAVAGGNLQHAQMPRSGVRGIPDVLLAAYVNAAMRLEELHPGCTGMTWPLLAGIGRKESTHAAGSQIDPDGDVNPAIVGPRLDGSGAGGNTTPHADSDGGVWDGDGVYDRAVGPMQFLPVTWESHGVDGSGDGTADPQNVFDATLGAAVYLCVSHPEGAAVDFTDDRQRREALLRYNHSNAYVREVLGYAEEYARIAARAAVRVPSGASGEQGRVAVEWALAQVGKPYLWGGTGPGAFDCSGLVMRAWEAAGVSIPRVTTDQVNSGTRVSLDGLQPGDLLFYDTGAPGGSPSHVTMYVGDGQMVNAPGSGRFVRVEPVDGTYYSARFVAAVRPG